MAEKVQDWKDWNGIKWKEGDFILAERMNLLQDNVQSLKDTIDIHNLLVENPDGTWNIAETRDVIMNVLTVAPSYDDLQFPVNEGDYCWHEGSLYRANTDIATAEVWTAAHWDIKPIGDDVIAAYERIDEIQKSAEIQTLGSLEDRIDVLENNTVNKWEDFPVNTVIPEGTYCIYENKIYYAINDFTKASSGDDSNPSSSHFCIEVANTTVRPKKIQIDDSAIETKKYGLKNENIMGIQSGYAKIIHIDKTELYNHGKIIYITTTNHSGSFFAAALLNINPLDNSYSYLDPETGEENIVNFVVGKNTNVIVFDTVDRDEITIKYRKLDITAAAQEKIRPAEITNNFYLLLYYGNNSNAYPNEPPREEILKDISIYYGVGTTQEQLDDLSARIDTTALEDSIEEIRNQMGSSTTETNKTLWKAIEDNQNNISSNSHDIETNADGITAINNKIGKIEDTTTLVAKINAKANQDVVDDVVGRVGNLESTSRSLNSNINTLTTTVQEIQTSIDTTGGKNLADTFSEQIGDYPTIWALLKAKINEGEYSQIHVGDYATLSLGNDKLDGLENFSFDFYVAGIDTYTGMADFENKNAIRHHIDFISKQLYITPRYFNKVAINWNGKNLGNNWISSDLYAYMNGLKTKIINNTTGYGDTIEIDYTATSNTASPFLTILNAFKDNDEKHPIITPRRGFMNSKVLGRKNTSDSKTIVWCDDWGKFWLPSEYEITGRNVYSGLPEAYCYFQYPLFKNNHSFFQSNKDYANNHKVTDHFYTSSAYWGGNTSFISLNIHTLFPTVQEAYFNGSSNNSNEIKLSFPICFRIEAAPQSTGGES